MTFLMLQNFTENLIMQVSMQGNHVYHLQKIQQLERYDYNEPQKGKDQADRESAIAK